MYVQHIIAKRALKDQKESTGSESGMEGSAGHGSHGVRATVAASPKEGRRDRL